MLKEQKHEVIIQGELNTAKIEKEHIDAMCKSLLRDILEYYQKVEKQKNHEITKCNVNHLKALEKFTKL